MSDILEKYTGMVEMQADMQGFNEHMTASESGYNAIGIGPFGTKIKGPINITGPILTNADIIIQGLNVSHKLTEYNYEMDRLRQSVERLERDNSYLMTQVNILVHELNKSKGNEEWT